MDTPNLINTILFTSYKLRSKVLIRRIQCLLAQTNRTLTRSLIFLAWDSYWTITIKKDGKNTIQMADALKGGILVKMMKTFLYDLESDPELQMIMLQSNRKRIKIVWICSPTGSGFCLGFETQVSTVWKWIATEHSS